MSEHVRKEPKFRWNEWLVVKIGRRTENEEETDKKMKETRKSKCALVGHLSGYYPLTLMDGRKGRLPHP